MIKHFGIKNEFDKITHINQYTNVRMYLKVTKLKVQVIITTMSFKNDAILVQILILNLVCETLNL